MFGEAKERDEFGDPNDGAEAGRVGPGDEEVEILWGLGRAKGR